MTALDKYLRETAASLAQGRQVPSTFEQRIAIGLVQARALELRHLAGELQIHGFTRHPLIKGLWAKMIERSSMLEPLGLEMCEAYPPDHREEKKLS